MGDLEPITRDEMLWSGEDLEPKTRREMYIRHLYDETQVIPDSPITREEMFILKAGEELHDVTIEQLTATENGTYSEQGVAYSPVIVNVPAPVLDKLTVTENGTYTPPSGTDGYDEVTVDVPLPDNAYLVKDIPATPSSIATFTDGSDLPMPKLEVAIEPVQEGSGDPSPENIRPISGWSEANVVDAGKNILKLKSGGSYTPSYRTVSVVNNEISYVSSTDLGISQVINNDGVSALFDTKKLKAGTYTFSLLTNLSTNASTFKLTFTDGTQVGNGNSFTLSEEKTIDSIIASTAIVVSAGAYYIKIQIESGNQATAYEPYNGHTYTIDLDGTRYGGKVDLVSGVMTVDRVGVDMGTLSWNYYNGIFYTDSLTNIKVRSDYEIYYLLTSIYKRVYTSLTIENMPDASIKGQANSVRVLIKDSRYTSVSAFKAAMNGVQLVYELATPLTIQLTPTLVKSLRGVNNVYADTGNILDLSYLAKEE